MGDGGNESVTITAGIWGFLVLFGLAIACWLLFRSMNNHLRKAQWQEEHDHPVRQRIPAAQPKTAAPTETPSDPPTETQLDAPTKAPDGQAEKT
ncbi:hypothetical protein [Flexivirga alba]|uniref:Uncharacterized protein n=1 Tax=Flexivirga alba TaxID=702742 RepID=A0ABW2ANG7_9MICO